MYVIGKSKLKILTQEKMDHWFCTWSHALRSGDFLDTYYPTIGRVVYANRQIPKANKKQTVHAIETFTTKKVGLGPIIPTLLKTIA